MVNNVTDRQKGQAILTTLVVVILGVMIKFETTDTLITIAITFSIAAAMVAIVIYAFKLMNK